MVRRKKHPTAQSFLLTIPDVAIQLGVCRTTVYNLINHSGLLLVHQVGLRPPQIVSKKSRGRSAFLDLWIVWLHSFCEE